jgi:hypothetical protein
MTAEQVEFEDPRVEPALEELRALIRRRYPKATFAVTRAHDDPTMVHLNATVDIEDLDDLVDLVIERELELQVDQGLPVHVIPTRPVAHARNM